MAEHRAIWLEPSCVANSGEDRHWCQDDTWGACEECGTKSVKYIIATEHEALVEALKLIEYASRKDSLTEHERLQSVRSTVRAALSRHHVGYPRGQT